MAQKTIKHNWQKVIKLNLECRVENKRRIHKLSEEQQNESKQVKKCHTWNVCKLIQMLMFGGLVHGINQSEPTEENKITRKTVRGFTSLNLIYLEHRRHCFHEENVS